MNIRYSTPASRDLLRLYNFLLPKSRSAAARAMRTITQAIRALGRFPDHGRPAPDGARELIVPFGQAGYIVRYRYAAFDREITILRIWHSLEDRT